MDYSQKKWAGIQPWRCGALRVCYWQYEVPFNELEKPEGTRLSHLKNIPRKFTPESNGQAGVPPCVTFVGI